MEEIAEDKLCADEDDAELEPELLGSKAGEEEYGEADGISDCQAEEDRPENVLDLREGDVAGCAEVAAEGFDSLPGEADAEEQRGTREEGDELTPPWAVARGFERQRNGVGRQGGLCDYQPMCGITLRRMSAASASAMTMAAASTLKASLA